MLRTLTSPKNPEGFFFFFFKVFLEMNAQWDIFSNGFQSFFNKPFNNNFFKKVSGECTSPPGMETITKNVSRTLKGFLGWSHSKGP